MKFARLTLCTLAAIALIAGCGNSTDPTRVNTETETPTLDNTPPPVPSGFRVTGDVGGSTSMTWSPSTAPDLAGYEIYVFSPDPNRETAYEMLYSTDETSYAVDPSSGFMTKYYRVRSVDVNGNRSALSAPVAVEVGPVMPGSGEPDDRPVLPTMEP